jgi:hypothetical protein
VFARALHWCLSWARLIQSIPSHLISLRSILILSTHLCFGLPSVSFLLAFPPISYMHSSSPSFMLHTLYTTVCLGKPLRLLKTPPKNNQESRSKQNVTYLFWLLVWLTLWPWWWRQYAPPNHQQTSASICYIPDDNILRSDCCENLKSNTN